MGKFRNAQIDAAEKRADKAEQEYKAGEAFFVFVHGNLRVLPQQIMKIRPY